MILRKSLNDRDQQMLMVADRYVLSQLASHRFADGPLDWKMFHEAGGRTLMAYPKKKKKKGSK